MEDVRIFESGNGDQGIDELAVHPGDVPYLPTRVAHCGT